VRKEEKMSRLLDCLRCWGWLACLGFLVLGTGCTKEGEVKVVPVEGKVLLGGTAMPIGTVTFVPDKDKGNKIEGTPTGPIHSDGSYKLIYNGKTGAPAGWYKVSISPRGMPTEMPPPGQILPQPPAINAKYQKPETSGISFEVTENAEPGKYDIKLIK